MSVSGQSGEVLSGQTINRLQNEIEKLQADNKRLTLDVADNIEYRNEAVINLDRAEKAEAELAKAKPVLDAVGKCHEMTTGQPKTEYNDMVLAVAGACAVVNDAYKKYKEE